MNLTNLSKYRSELMGIAMLMVVFHHLPFEINNPIFHYVKQNAGFGVDIFLLLSGIGLYYSISKENTTLLDYYFHRAIRIFPIYALVILAVSIIKGNFNIVAYLLKVSTIGWWTTGVCYDWFIPTIVMLYAIFPVFYHFILRQNGKKTGMWGGYLSVAIIYLTIIVFVPYNSDFQMLLRFPVFFLGTVFGKLIKEQPAMCSNRFFTFILLILFVFGLSLSIYAFIFCNAPCGFTEIPEIKKTGWLFVPYVFMVPFFCLSLCSVFCLKTTSLMCRLLKNVGIMSIEVYLLHSQFINLTRYWTNEYGWSKPLVGGVMVILCFIVSWYVHKLNDWITNMIRGAI